MNNTRPDEGPTGAGAPRTAWTDEHLARLGTAEEIRLAARRPDGTLRNPVTIWIVRDGDDLYVRSVNGRESAWFRGTQAQHAGCLWASGMEVEVRFVAVAEPASLDRVDAAYRAKYHRYAASIIRRIVSPEARAATIKLVPSAASG